MPLDRRLKRGDTIDVELPKDVLPKGVFLVIEYRGRGRLRLDADRSIRLTHVRKRLTDERRKR